MVWEFDCPVDDCEFTATANGEGEVVESAQQHMDDKHGQSATRPEVEQHVIGAG